MTENKNTPIKTPVSGLKVGMTEVPVNTESMPAYYAMPEQAGRLPVVLVIQEIFGVHEHIQDICRRFAQEGFLAIAPELYFRQGDPAAFSEVSDIVSKIVSQVPDEQVLQDLDACLVWAGLHGGNLAQVCVTGFCWGGRVTWRYAEHQPMVNAAVAWYGRLTAGHGPIHTRHPIDVASTLQAPVLGLYGEKDAGIPLPDVRAMQKALTLGNEHAHRSTIRVYEGADHGFFADYRPMYEPKAAKDAWVRCLAWMRSNLKPG
ncbi:MAG: dienelactone hydrolase family protein [Orrella sp.]